MEVKISSKFLWEVEKPRAATPFDDKWSSGNWRRKVSRFHFWYINSTREKRITFRYSAVPSRVSEKPDETSHLAKSAKTPFLSKRKSQSFEPAAPRLFASKTKFKTQPRRNSVGLKDVPSTSLPLSFQGSTSRSEISRLGVRSFQRKILNSTLSRLSLSLSLSPNF